MIEKTIEYPSGKITIKLEYDPDPSSPDEMGDCEPEFFRARRGEELRNKLEEEFGAAAGKVAQELASGYMHEAPDKSWYFGVSCYGHGSRAFALCRSSRAMNFPDQRFDVIQLVGWIKITQQLRRDWGIHGKPGVRDKTKANAIGTLQEWEAYLNGEVYGYVVEAVGNAADGDSVDSEALEQDSCWGYYRREDAEEDAEEAAMHLAAQLGWAASQLHGEPLQC